MGLVCKVEKWLSAKVASPFLIVLAVTAGSACLADQPVMTHGAMSPLVSSSIEPVEKAYQLAPHDIVRLTVLGEPDLSDPELPIEADGFADVPYLGRIRAAGVTTAELSALISSRLKPRYLIDPHVSVTIVRSPTLRYTVEGSVNQPGIYDLTAPTTLLQALAKAQSPTRTAELKKVAIIRTAGTRRTGAFFDLRRIRTGHDVDPPIEPGDSIIVSSSWSKTAFRDFLTAAPALAVFRPY